MMYRIQSWKQLAVFSLFLLLTSSCKKQRPTEGNSNPPPGQENPPPSLSSYEPLSNHSIVSYCGSPLVSGLKTKDGTDIGTVTVGNDGAYLYLTYNLVDDWYLGMTYCYAGQEFLIPRDPDTGNPNHEQFPGKHALNFCDLLQTFTFRVPLSSLTSDNGQCPTNTQYYIAMRASVKQISDPADCDAAIEQAAWGAPFLINPGNTNEWATAFYYCKQDCLADPPPPPAPAWCAYSQGYWFNKTGVTWCQDATFGNLQINQQDGTSLWPAQNNWVKKAFFQATALQMSMYCINNGEPIPDSIANDYATLQAFLSQLTYAEIENGTFPSGADTSGVRSGTGNIGRWICQYHCNSSEDSTACSGY